MMPSPTHIGPLWKPRCDVVNTIVKVVVRLPERRRNSQVRERVNIPYLFTLFIIHISFLILILKHLIVLNNTTRNSLNSNRFTDRIFMSVIWGRNYRRKLFRP
jgi:hypothetical protein